METSRNISRIRLEIHGTSSSYSVAVYPDGTLVTGITGKETNKNKIDPDTLHRIYEQANAVLSKVSPGEFRIDPEIFEECTLSIERNGNSVAYSLKHSNSGAMPDQHLLDIVRAISGLTNW